MQTAQLHNEELFLAAFDAYGYAARKVAGGDLFATREMIQASNRLFDHCLALGMPFDEPVIENWAAIRAAKILVSA